MAIISIEVGEQKASGVFYKDDDPLAKDAIKLYMTAYNFDNVQQIVDQWILEVVRTAINVYTEQEGEKAQNDANERYKPTASKGTRNSKGKSR